MYTHRENKKHAQVTRHDLIIVIFFTLGSIDPEG